MTLLYAESEKLGSVVRTQPAVSCTVTCQKHRYNMQFYTLEDNNRRSVLITLLDYITVGMSERFGLLLKAAYLLTPIPLAIAADGDCSSYEEIKEEYQVAIPSPSVFDDEWGCWRKKKQSSHIGRSIVQSITDTLIRALKQYDEDRFPNITTLLRLAWTDSVTSVETERCNSALKSLNTKFRGTMTEERLTSLCILKNSQHHYPGHQGCMDTLTLTSRIMHMSVM